jgi:MurNAc alpha-1-phosphate uridylyltransferase
LKGEPFFIHNVDILSDIDLTKMMEMHIQQGAIATVAVLKTESERYFMTDSKRQLCGWGNKGTGEKILSRKNTDLETVSFTGIHIVSAEFFNYIPEGVSSIIHAYLEAAKSESIYCYPVDDNRWLDVGTPESLKEAENIF